MKNGYKQTVIGILPEEWQVMTVSEFAKIENNKRIPLSSDVRASMKGEFPYCGANGIVDYINDYKYHGLHILMAEDGGNFHDYQTRPITYLMNGKFWVNNHAHVLRAKNGEHIFLHYSLVHKDITKHIIGSTRTKLNRSVLEKIELAVPPLPEQQKIAEILSTVDEKIDVIDEQLAQTQELKKGLMQRLLTRGIGHTTFKDSPLGQIPESWEVKQINEVSTYVDYRGKTPPKVEEGVFLVTAKNIRSGRIDYSLSQEYVPVELYDDIMGRGKPKIGDVLITTEAPLGEVAAIDKENIALAQRVIKYRADKTQLDSTYFKYSLLSPQFQIALDKESTGSTVKGIKGSRLHKMQILIPASLAEQHQIAEILTTVDDKLQVLTDKKTHYQELKRGLMQQLLTGQRRVKVAEPVMA